MINNLGIRVKHEILIASINGERNIKGAVKDLKYNSEKIKTRVEDKINDHRCKYAHPVDSDEDESKTSKFKKFKNMFKRKEKIEVEVIE